MMKDNNSRNVLPTKLLVLPPIFSDFSDNSLRNIPPNIFEFCDELEQVDFSGNKIDRIGELKFGSNIKSIDLSRNDIFSIGGCTNFLDDSKYKLKFVKHKTGFLRTQKFNYVHVQEDAA